MKRFASTMLLTLLLLMGLALPAFAQKDGGYGGNGGGYGGEPPTSDYMGSFAITPRIGYALYSDFRSSTPLDDRHSFNFNLDLNFGNKGSGFDLGFFYAFEDVTSPRNILVDGGIHAIGLELGNTHRFKYDRMYVGVGFHSKLGYGFSDFTDHVIEITVKIPVSFTYYILNDLGINFGFGIGYNTSIYKMAVLNDNTWWGAHGIYFDAMAGIRWP